MIYTNRFINPESNDTDIYVITDSDSICLNQANEESIPDLIYINSAEDVDRLIVALRNAKSKAFPEAEKENTVR